MNLNAVGIDISKGKSMVSILRPMGEVVEMPFEVQHNNESLKNLAKHLLHLDGDTKVVMEHTGRYYEAVANVLFENGLNVCTVNPLLIKAYGNNSLRRVKTDKADAVKIARYALDNWVELREYGGTDEIRYQLKTLNRQFQLASKQRTETVNNLIALLEQSFPGVRACFSSPPRKDGTQKWVDFVHTFYHADCVRNVSREAFVRRYQKWCRQHGYDFNEKKADAIHTAAKELVVLVSKTPLCKLMIQQAAEQVTAISASVEAYRAEMDKLASKLPEYPVVMEMYGVGPSFGPQLMAEIGDIRRFTRRNSLPAFAGVDPMPNQSGEKNVRSNKSSKRGSPHLRKTLFNIMDVYIQRSPQDEPIYQFLNRKRSEGKPYYVYMTAGANKFLRRYYAKVRDYLNALGARASTSTTDESN